MIIVLCNVQSRKKFEYDIKGSFMQTMNHSNTYTSIDIIKLSLGYITVTPNVLTLLWLGVLWSIFERS